MYGRPGPSVTPYPAATTGHGGFDSAAGTETAPRGYHRPRRVEFICTCYLTVLIKQKKNFFRSIHCFYFHIVIIGY